MLKNIYLLQYVLKYVAFIKFTKSTLISTFDSYLFFNYFSIAHLKSH